jgi:pantoate--beta-alanine ligase
MRLATTVADVRRWRRESGGTVGLVPTMGALHEGHLSLVRTARLENDRVAVTLFVNPTQFGPAEDFTRYPRDVDRDRRLLEEAGADLLFAPTVEEMYPEGAAATIDVGPVAAPLEGERRPGHFRGVATVVMKLLQLATPDRAYFGEKDAQQLRIIRRMVRDLHMEVAIVGCPTARAADGLALSSRNGYLNGAERQAAPVLHRALAAAAASVEAGERDAARVVDQVRAALATEPLARIDYVEAVDDDSLQPVAAIRGRVLLAAAVFFGKARLIDNVVLSPRMV